MTPDPLVPYLVQHLPELWLRTGEHLMLTGCSTAVAVLVGIPAGILLWRVPLLRGLTLGFIGILQTIPSLAMLVILLALFQKIGVLPAIIALILYALLPIVRNTLTGLEGVSPEVMEAAKGMGMTGSQELIMVRLPLAAPVIIAGVRTAAVVGVGIATLSAFVGAGGLGQFINRGLALSNTRLILLGALPAALLALAVDFSIGVFGWGLKRRPNTGTQGLFKRGLRPAALLMPFWIILLGVLPYAFGPSRQGPANEGAGSSDAIRIGTKNFTEQLILGELMAQVIEAKTAVPVDRRFNLGGTMICHGALVNGEIDLYAEYTGTGLTAILKHSLIKDPEEALTTVREVYMESYAVRWLSPFGFNNTYAMTVRGMEANQKGWHRISDLRLEAPRLRAGFTAEFSERPDGYPGLRKAYDLDFGEVRDLDPAIMVEALVKGEVDVICAFATDGRIAAHHLKPLEDDRRFFPPYYAAPLLREVIHLRHPEVAHALVLLGGQLDNSTMQSLNYEVDAEKRSPAEVAEAFLRARGLL